MELALSPHSKLANRIEDIILLNDRRGINILKQFLPSDFCARSARTLLDCERGPVIICTGFCVAGYGETDGPPGAYFLARALKKLCFEPLIISDACCRGYFDGPEPVPNLIINSAVVLKNGWANRLLKKYQPVAAISIERCGRAADGDYYNMRKQSIREQTLPLDELFIQARGRVKTIGIGDGGNEIGMGSLQVAIEKYLDIIPCAVATDEVIIASVSNWGSYGIIAYLELLTGKDLLPTPQEVRNYYIHLVSHGAVDGVTGQRALSVDSFDLSVEIDVVRLLKNAVKQVLNNGFKMGEDYTGNSLSQQSIAVYLIDLMYDWLKNHDLLRGRILDLGCGPGNITRMIADRFSRSGMKVHGSDFDEDLIEACRQKFHDLRFYNENMYSIKRRSAYNAVFSNEVLHWMPRLPARFYQDRGIIYYFFAQNLRREYENWGKNNYRQSLRNIWKLLRPGGAAFLQFGYSGQLLKVYGLINNVIEDLYPDYLETVKFPLYYLQQEEIASLMDEAGFAIEYIEFIERDLYENTPEQVTGYIKGFTSRYLQSVLGSHKAARFYRELQHRLENNSLKEITGKQMHEAVVIARRPD